ARGGAPRGGPGDEAPDDPPTPHEHPVDPPSPCPSSDQPGPSTQTDMAFVTRDGYMIDWLEAFLATSTAGPSSTPIEHPSTFFQGGFPDCSSALQTHPFTQMYATPPPFGSQFGSVAPSSSDSGVSGYDSLRDQLASHHEQVTPPAVPPLRRGHRDVRPPPCGTGGCLAPPQRGRGRGRRGGQ
ncbi:hypothetical protein PIB30_106516, partial [Stylosanthes scabra]|nr:hypothetical protein [Stylosanthes scabra]